MKMLHSLLEKQASAKAIAEAQNTITAQRNEIAELRAVLRDIMKRHIPRHRSDCLVWVEPFGDKCSCGELEQIDRARDLLTRE